VFLIVTIIVTKISSRFSIAVHNLSLLATAKDAHCTSEWIAKEGRIGRRTSRYRRCFFALKGLKEVTLLGIYQAVEVVEEGELFHIHEQPNPDCQVGANIQAVLELILEIIKSIYVGKFRGEWQEVSVLFS